MSEKNGLIVGYILDGKGGGQKVSWEQIDNWSSEQGFLWIHLNFTSVGAKKWLTKSSGLEKIKLSTLVAEESRPRSVVEENSLLLFLRGVNFNPGEDPEDMVSIRIHADQHKVISTRKRRLISIKDLCNDIESGIGPLNPKDLIIKLNGYITERIADVVDSIEDRADDIEKNIHSEESKLIRKKISDLRRESISIRRYLAPQRAALQVLQMGETNFLNPYDRARIREAADRLIHYVEDLDAAKERTAVSFEELNNRIADNLNRRMYIMSIAAVIFLPITFITGLLGINVGGIPGAKYEWAILLVAFICTFIATLLLYFFRRKKIM
jgi:zinc transporter